MAIKTKNRLIKKNFTLETNGLYKKIGAYEPMSVANSIPITWKKAKNYSVYDGQGNKWIDLTSGIFVANAGHANPYIKKAIKKQVDSDLMFSYNYPTEIKNEFLTKLLTLSPGHFDKAILLNSGSEAVDTAYKLLKLWGCKNHRKYIITFSGSYHGRGLSNDLICGSPEKAVWSGVKDESIIFLDFPYDQETKFDPKKLPPPSQIIGFMLETFQGWGAWFYPPKYIDELVRFAKKNKILLCFDEMQSGFYRLGPVYGYLTYGNFQPDIICLGKGISSSLPMSAVLSRKEIVDVDPKADLHGTQSANPVCCAAALANLNFLSSQKQMKHGIKIAKVFMRGMTGIKKYKIVKKVNVRGMIAGLIFDDAEVASNIVQDCVRNGVLPVCTNRNSIKIAPPLTITADALTEALAVLQTSIKKYA